MGPAGGLLHGQRSRRIEQLLAKLRNSVAHPSSTHLLTPVDCAKTLGDLAEFINQLWGRLPAGGPVVVSERRGIRPTMRIDLLDVQHTLIVNALTLLLLVMTGPLVPQRANVGATSQQLRLGVEPDPVPVPRSPPYHRIVCHGSAI